MSDSHSDSMTNSEPVERLPVTLSQCDEHLVRAQHFVSVLHPHDVGFCHSLDSTAQPGCVTLRHRLIGRMLGERHTCSWTHTHTHTHSCVSITSEDIALTSVDFINLSFNPKMCLHLKI